MYNISSILFVILLWSVDTISQEPSEKGLSKLKKVNCEGVDENSSKKEQIQCQLIDVVLDGINYSPTKTRKSNIVINSPITAWKQLRKLYPEYVVEDFNCWSEYYGYYVFSLGCNEKNAKKICGFYCVIYVPLGGKEFWFFTPHT